MSEVSFTGDIEADADLLENVISDFEDRYEYLLTHDHLGALQSLRMDLKDIAGHPYDDGSLPYPDGYPELPQ